MNLDILLWTLDSYNSFMSNKRTKIILAILILLLGTGIVLVKQFILDKKPTAQEQALQQAREYRPKGGCGAAITPAIHTSTGAKYDFPSTCLPDGWESAR